MSEAIVRADGVGIAAIEQVLVQGDLSKLTAQMRVEYYDRLCQSLGLNPLTRPFEYLTLQGKTVLYARRDCTDQLRKIHSVSIKVISRDTTEDMLVVTTQATTPDGRTDESIGAVPIAGLKGEALANALMKADTKAKRRVTLSICGLGMLDEEELDGARLAPPGAHSPHAIEGSSSIGDTELFLLLLGRLQYVKDSLPECSTYDKTLELRAIIGTSAQQSELTKQIQAARENLNEDQRRELSKIWQHCHRQLAKLESSIPKPDVTASFTDEPDDAENFDRSL